MAKIWFKGAGTKPDLKAQIRIPWCLSNLGPLKFISPHDKPPIPLLENGAVSSEIQIDQFVILEIEEKNAYLRPGFYLSSLSPEQIWKSLFSLLRHAEANRSVPIESLLETYVLGRFIRT